jgi:hypothetical protein
MVSVGATAHDAGVSRLLVLWSRPVHLNAEEADRWVRAEVRALLAAEAVRSVELTRLESASPRHAADWQWMLELEVTGPVRECVERGPCAEWLGDLRLLGMRPAVVVAAGPIALEGDDG